MLTRKITLPDWPHPVIISKNFGFRALYLARQNEFRLINAQQIFFSFFGCWLLPEKFSFSPKMMVLPLPEFGGCSPQPLARTPMSSIQRGRVLPAINIRFFKWFRVLRMHTKSVSCIVSGKLTIYTGYFILGFILSYITLMTNLTFWN